MRGSGFYGAAQVGWARCAPRGSRLVLYCLLVSCTIVLPWHDLRCCAQAPVASSGVQSGAAPSLPSAAPSLQPYHIRSRRFSLPIQIHQASYIVTAVQLYVSIDGGQSWQLYAQQPPNVREFAFQAPRDGSYWFASKTVDDRNQSHPEGPPQPEQWVVVDTRQPLIRLQTELGRTGEVVVAWHVSDEWLDTGSLKLEYREGVLAAWQPLTDPRALSQPTAAVGSAAAPGVIGQYVWQPQVESRVVEIRMLAADRAGNVAAEIQRVFLPKVSRPVDNAGPTGLSTNSAVPGVPPYGALPPAANPAGGGTTASPTYAAGTPGNGTGSATNTATTPAAPSTPAASRYSTAPSTIPPDSASTFNSQPGSFPNSPFGQSTAAGPVTSQANTSSSVRNDLATSPSPASLAAGGTSEAPAAVRPGVSSPNAQWVNNPFYQAQTQVGTAGQAGGLSQSAPNTSNSANPLQKTEQVGSSSSTGHATTAPATGGPSNWPSVPDGQVIRMTRSRRFQLEYDLESGAANNIKEVQLWGTQDGGETWQKWGIDPDLRSPFEVEVDRDGIYGFRVVLLNANGLASEVPRPGSPADLWVGVDTVPPRVQLTGVSFATGERAGQLEIRWQAHDERLGPNPVQLSFSTEATGPWTTIAANISNSGVYYWVVDATVPKAAYIRIDVCDEAGNCASQVTPQPVTFQGLIPRARIRSVQESR